jgi:drug/metabolite transporter (DMT)-like permease
MKTDSFAPQPLHQTIPPVSAPPAVPTAKANNPPASTASPSRTALVLAFAAIYLIWGSTYLGIRVTVETMPPWLMAAARFVVAGTLLFTYLKMRGAGWPTAPQWRTNGIIGTFMLLGGNGLVVWAEQTIPSGIAALFIGTGPVFIVLTEWAWPGGTRPTVLTFTALLLGLTGITWLAAPWENAAQGGLNPAGVIALLGACFFWGIGAIYSRHARHDAGASMNAALQMLGGGAALTLVATLSGDFAQFDFRAISFRSWGAFAYLVVAGSLVGYSTFVWLLKHSTPARVATYAYVNPIVALFLGWLLLDEPVSSRTLVASAIIVTAVVIITVQKTSRKKSQSN